ncbi:MAG: ABC transporter permease [Chloroflexi bacterium]|nr:ABC transporter permease [Chloroflexota bacterium]
MPRSGSALAITGAHLKARVIQLARIPAFIVPTLGFPAMFYLFFVVNRELDVKESNAALTGFAVFAVLGVAFFQFGVGIAAERMFPWERYLRTLPGSASPRFVAQTLSAVVFALIGVAIVVVIASAVTEASLSPGLWLLWAGSLLFGSIPFAMFGIALGYWADPRAALPIANVIYLPLSYVGGLWVPPSSLPDVLQGVSRFLPTRHYAEVVWAIMRGDGPPLLSWLWLLAFGAAATVAAAWGYRNEEALRYH